MSYQPLTREQRYQIYALVKAHFSQLQIALEKGVHPSTISRQLARNRDGRAYRPKQAQELSDQRKQVRARPRHGTETWLLVQNLLLKQWSPEQISGWLRREQNLALSHQRSYQYVYADKARGGKLHLNLRSQKQRRKRPGRYSRRALIPNRQSIDRRPRIVEAKGRVGDGEADTIIGKHHQQAILGLVERKTKLTLLKKLERARAEAVEQATGELMKPLMKKVQTITSDNGREFAHHQSISEQLEAAFYFAHPYHSWERGLNENTNGWVRQYFPKGSDFTQITDNEIAMVRERLNNRPRKTLGFKTPSQLFFQRTENCTYKLNSRKALPKTCGVRW
jgi:IS30 family transposase